MCVSHFVVCFVKTFAKYPRNAKYEKCIASLRVSQFYPPSGFAVIELVETNKKAYVYVWPIIKIQRLLATEIYEFTKICKFQKQLNANLRLLNDYSLNFQSKLFFLFKFMFQNEEN